MIEDIIAKHTEALNTNTEAIKAHTAALLGLPVKEESAKPAPKGKVKPAPAPEPETEPEADMTPTKVEVKTKLDDTPNVPSKTAPAPGQPEAAEHVDVDETIAQVQSIVKRKLDEGDAAAVKVAWQGVLKKFGVPRVAELRNDPARLLQALAAAKAL
jgi:hypothetical protein